MKRLFSDRRFRLIRNILLILIAVLLCWILLGMPALTKAQTFRRAMREHFLKPKAPEVYFGEDGYISALAKVNDMYVQTRVGRTGLRWDHFYWSESEATDGVYIIPLFAYGRMTNSPEVAVLAEGERAELTFICEDGAHPMEYAGRQDGWFLFRFIKGEGRSSLDGSAYSHFIRGNMYMHIGTPNAPKEPCSFLFVSYDASGNELQRVEKKY